MKELNHFLEKVLMLHHQLTYISRNIKDTNTLKRKCEDFQPILSELIAEYYQLNNSNHLYEFEKIKQKYSLEMENGRYKDSLGLLLKWCWQILHSNQFNGF